jgi:hypothetical protein
MIVEAKEEGMGSNIPLDGKDNWRGRSKGMKCSSCIYFVSKTVNIGRCRRNAPTMSGWPVLFPGDWCGNHKLDETKI